MARQMVTLTMSLETWMLFKGAVEGGLKALIFDRKKQALLRNALVALRPSAPFDEV